MTISYWDVAIIVIYIVATIFVGFYISKKASKDINAYFLGGNTIPWYVLGISNASGMFDIAGTMWLVSLCFIYGLKSIWIPWLWPVFNQIFLMIYLAVWLRRSNVLTGAEWIKTRFGQGRGSELSHNIVIVFALVSVIGFLAYAFKGIGKFSAAFLPFDLTPNEYALVFMGITTLYVIKGGMYSVVFTEVLQFFIMTVASFGVGFIAMSYVSPEALEAVIPEGWKTPFFGWELNLDWTGLMDAVDKQIEGSEYSMFGYFMMMVLFKGVLVSAAGPAPNYDMQRVLATRSPAEAAKMSGIVNVALFFPRYFLITGLSVMALVLFRDQLLAMGNDIDFEMILPWAIREYVPVGLKGLLMAGLLAAFMSTFAATVNAAPAYLVNDIYKRYINPGASDKQLVNMSYLSSLAVVVVGVGFGFVVDSIDSALQWIVSALWGGYTAANVLKWYWWRLNGHGYFWGMVSGIAASLVIPLLFPALSPLNSFPFILAVAFAGCILGSLLTRPQKDETLMKFYRNVRPWGFWGPVKEKVMAEDPDFVPNNNFSRDMVNVAVGLLWQTALVALPIYIVIREATGAWIVAGVLLVTSLILKKNWYDKLPDEKPLPREDKDPEPVA